MIFDTNIFIYADRGIERAREVILSATLRSISTVTYMEYVPFCRNKDELAKFDNLLTALNFNIYEIDNGISISARNYVKQFALSHRVEMADALIAATAMKYDETICTANIRHFTPIKGLSLNRFSHK